MNKWISTRSRRPSGADANEYGCVLAYHVFQGAMMAGWRDVKQGGYFTHWQRTPEPPPDAEKEREAMNREMVERYGYGF